MPRSRRCSSCTASRYASWRGRRQHVSGVNACSAVRATCNLDTSPPIRCLATQCSTRLCSTTYRADDVLRDDLIVQPLQQHMTEGLHMTIQSASCQPVPLCKFDTWRRCTGMATYQQRWHSSAGTTRQSPCKKDFETMCLTHRGERPDARLEALPVQPRLLVVVTAARADQRL